MQKYFQVKNSQGKTLTDIVKQDLEVIIGNSDVVLLSNNSAYLIYQYHYTDCDDEYYFLSLASTYKDYTEEYILPYEV